MTIDATTAQMIARRYDREVEDAIKMADLGRYIGTDLLNPVQMEVNAFNEKMKTATSVSSIEAESMASVRKIHQLLRGIANDKFGKSNLGSISGQMSMLDVPAWSSALSEVTMRIEQIGSQYGKLILNQPDKDKIDRMIASSLVALENAFAMSPTPAAANNAKNQAMATLSNIETMLNQRKMGLMQQSLTNLIAQKEVDLLNTISVLKMNESSLKDGEIAVVKMHSVKATEFLATMKSNPASYDKAILQQQLATFDSILAPLVQMRESVQYRAALSGGNFSSPRRPTNKTFGFGSVPKRRYHEDKTPIPTNRSPFRDAPNAVSVRGLGSAVANSVSTQMKQVEAGGDVSDVIQYNLEIGSAQGFITPADEAILREQLSQVNIDSFGGDQEMYDAAKSTLKNTIDYLAEQYANQIKSGLIDANLPPNAPGVKDEKWYKRKNILSRTIMTGTIGLGGAAVLGVLTLLYMNSRESKTSTEEAKS